MQRKRVNVYIPCWEGPVKGWAVKEVKRNLWRMGNAYEFDDLLQDAYVAFLEVRTKYSVNSPQHFMGLFKTTFRNMLHDLAVQRVPTADVEVEDVVNPTIIEQDDATLLASIMHGPTVVKELILALADDDTGLQRGKRWGRRPKTRETVNGYYCRITGNDPTKVNLRAMFDEVVR